MNTKLKGDLSEQIVVCEALKRGWGVSIPIGDRLPYDLVFDVNDRLIKIQVKTAWIFRGDSNVWVVETRRTKTNRRKMVRDRYEETDCDFVIASIPENNVFWIFPIKSYLSWKGAITLKLEDNGQRRLDSTEFKNGWNLIPEWADGKEIFH